MRRGRKSSGSHEEGVVYVGAQSVSGAGSSVEIHFAHGSHRFLRSSRGVL